jgi:predicted transposase YbfD/YdcC
VSHLDGKTNEITVFRSMLAELDLADTAVTFDALHSQTAHARFLVKEKKAHYIAVIKGNQPLLYQPRCLGPSPALCAGAAGAVAGPRTGGR